MLTRVCLHKNVVQFMSVVDFIMYKNKVSITPSILIENSLTPFDGGTIKNFNQSITVSFDTGTHILSPYQYNYSTQCVVTSY